MASTSAHGTANAGKCRGCGGGTSVPPVRAGAGAASTRGMPGKASSVGHFVRPRFFAGQLLDEQDLQRLECYIVEKQRWQNRHFHGWGVVCGLKVSCDQDCKGGSSNQVHVQAGYALGPGGEDIVVREEEVVDVCRLLCRDCENASANPKEDAVDQWVLSIEYEEHPAPKACGCRCDCGGAPCGGGCCGGACCSSCEPRAIREGYRFSLTPVPPEASTVPWRQTGAYGTIAECLKPLSAAFSEFSRNAASVPIGTRLLALRNKLQGIIDTHPQFDCRLQQSLAKIDVSGPESGTSNPTAAQAQAFYQLVEVGAGLVQECVCGGLLPPCPEFSAGGVPIAIVRVQRGGCNVVSVCDWDGRKLAHTVPIVHHYLAPVAAVLKERIARLCCMDLSSIFKHANAYDSGGEPVPSDGRDPGGVERRPAYRVPIALDGHLDREARRALLPEVDRYVKGEGKPLKTTLKEMVPHATRLLPKRLAPLAAIVPDAWAFLVGSGD